MKKIFFAIIFVFSTLFFSIHFVFGNSLSNDYFPNIYYDGYKTIVTGHSEIKGNETASVKNYLWIDGKKSISGVSCWKLHSSINNYFDTQNYSVSYLTIIGNETRIYGIKIVQNGKTYSEILYEPYSILWKSGVQIGAQWNHTYTSKENNFISDLINITRISMQHKFVGFESTITPYGRYSDCVKIVYNNGTETMIAGKSYLSELGNIQNWYAKGIGLVKTYNRDAEATTYYAYKDESKPNDEFNPSNDEAALYVSQSNQTVSSSAGTTSFNVSNIGTGTMSWNSYVISGGEWLSIVNNNSGINSGVITCLFNTNGKNSSRIGTIRITADGATNNPVDVTVTQAASLTRLTKNQVSQLYVSIFGRASEGSGNAYWQAHSDMANAASAMLDTQAAKYYFGANLNTNQAFIEHIYLNTLNKTIADDFNGINHWVRMLNAGTSRGEAVAALVGAIYDYAPDGPYYNPDDTATVAAYNQFMNRVEVSNYMADNVYATPDDWETSTSFSYDMVVTDDPATVFTAMVVVNGFTDEPVLPGCGAYIAPNVWKEFDCYNLAAIGKTTNDDFFIPSWRLIMAGFRLFDR